MAVATKLIVLMVLLMSVVLARTQCPTLGTCGQGDTCVTELDGHPVCVPDICLLPPKRGKCKGRKPRFYFNENTMRCESFTYGGCVGNENRFYTYHECKNFCTGTSTETYIG